MLTYLKLTGMKLGYLLNFGDALMKDDIIRVVNGLAEREWVFAPLASSEKRLSYSVTGRERIVRKLIVELFERVGRFSLSRLPRAAGLPSVPGHSLSCHPARDKPVQGNNASAYHWVQTRGR